MDDLIQMNDLLCVGQVNDTVLLFKAKDTDKSISIDLSSKEFSIDEMEKFLKFIPFEEVDVNNELLQEFYRDWVYRKFDKKVLKILISYTEAIR